MEFVHITWYNLSTNTQSSSGGYIQWAYLQTFVGTTDCDPSGPLTLVSMEYVAIVNVRLSNFRRIAENP